MSVASTSVSGLAPHTVSAELRDALCKVNEFCERVERLEQIANDTESNLVGVLDKVEAPARPSSRHKRTVSTSV